MIPHVAINPEAPAIGKNLLNKVCSHQITMQEFEKECAYWMLGELSNMQFKEYPNKPYEIADYLNRKKINPTYKLSREFWEQPHIVDYLRIWLETVAINSSNWYWLNFIESTIPIEDSMNLSKVCNIKKTFPSNYGQ